MEAAFIRGDVNFDGDVNLTDAIAELEYLFLGKIGPEKCLDGLDVDDDGSTNIGDPIYSLRFLFNGAQPIPQPYPNCGEDPTDDDDLNCVESFCPDVDCMRQEDLDQLLLTHVDEVICLESPLISTTIAGNDIVVCPEGSGICPNGGFGCPVLIDEVTIDIDRNLNDAYIQLTGSIPSIIFEIDPILGGPTECDFSVDLSGAVSIPFTANELPNGALEIVTIGDGTIDAESVVLNLDSNDANPSLICGLALGFEDAIKDIAIEQLGAALNEALIEVTNELTGTILCPEL